MTAVRSNRSAEAHDARLCDRGTGFIGSALLRHLIAETGHEVLNYDKLTYAGTLTTVAEVAHNPRYRAGLRRLPRPWREALGDILDDLIGPIA